ncbi:MAG: class I SAM-dependent methyltransferase, partial [Betaproteobacteria bacterium]|nr:class I SAM-dependent methyltransferase [Betaproteobacteria bacterium]
GRLHGRSVLDVGCGLGDFAGWCARQSIAPDYTGIDITPRMVELARECLPAHAFHDADLLALPEPPAGRRWDYVLASGIFAKRQENPEGYLREAVARMYSLCAVAVAFNVLSTWAPAAAEGREFHADPLRTLEFCRGLTPLAVLRHDYHPRDFTIYLYRERQA